MKNELESNVWKSDFEFSYKQIELWKELQEQMVVVKWPYKEGCIIENREGKRLYYNVETGFCYRID